jgi:hypothetical protein
VLSTKKTGKKRNRIERLSKKSRPVNLDQESQWEGYCVYVPCAKGLVTLLKSLWGSPQALKLTKHNLLQHPAKATEQWSD